MNRSMLWVSTALVLTFALFPSYVSHLFGVQPTAAESTAASTAPETESTLAGHWVTALEEQNGETIDVIMDLGVVNSRWVGEFDLSKYNVMNYPVEVKSSGATIMLFFTAIGMSFAGSIGEDGLLTGVGQSQGAENEPVTFRRSEPAEFPRTRSGRRRSIACRDPLRRRRGTQDAIQCRQQEDKTSHAVVTHLTGLPAWHPCGAGQRDFQDLQRAFRRLCRVGADPQER